MDHNKIEFPPRMPSEYTAPKEISISTAMLDSLPILISYIDCDKVYRYCNKGYGTWFGIPSGDIIGKLTVAEIVGEEAYAKILPYIERTLNGEHSTYEMQLPIARANNKDLYYRSYYTPHRDENGKVIGLVAIIEDISERRIKESDAADHQRILQLALDAGKFGTWVVKIKDRISVLDATLAEIFQLPDNSRELPLDRFVEMVAPQHREMVSQSVAKTLSDQGDFSEQYIICRDDGTERWLSTYGRIHRDALGTADRVIGVSHDITRQKIAEQELLSINQSLENRAAERAEALQMSEATLRAIVNTAADAILTVSDQSTILSANPTAANLFSRGREKADRSGLVGRPVSEFFREDVVQLIVNPAPHQTDSKDSDSDSDSDSSTPRMNRTTLARSLDGVEFPAEFSIARAEEVPFSVVLLRDISERRKLQSAAVRAAEEEKERIARDLHDGLGSQLGGITCLSKALETELETKCPELVAKAREITDAARDSISMTRRLAHGLYAVGAQPDALVEALRDFAEATSNTHPTRCEFHIDELIEVKNRIVANHLFRIAQEAVSNAVRHGNATITTIELTRKGSTLQLTITDNGSGFESPDAAGKPGLGLRTMHYRAQEMHGSLKIEHVSDGTGVKVSCLVTG